MTCLPPGTNLGALDINFWLAAHRQWKLEGKGIVTFELREKLLNRDVELEYYLYKIDEVIEWVKNGGIT